MAWQHTTAANQLTFWTEILGAPHEYLAAMPATRGSTATIASASWFGDRLGGRTFLGHQVPFAKFTISDVSGPCLTAFITVYMGQDAADRVNKMPITVSYNTSTKQMRVIASGEIELAASIVLSQRVQSGASAPNTSVGELISMRQKIIYPDGTTNIDQARAMYDTWYSVWVAGTQQTTYSATERFELGMRSTNPFKYFGGSTAEHMGGTRNLLAAQLAYDRM
jgi:hypothetical protein